MSADQRAEIARDYLATARRTSVEQLPPSLLMRECAELRRLLGQVLGILADRIDAGRQLAEIRDVLAAFDWEHHDRQTALERIGQIAGES